MRRDLIRLVRNWFLYGLSDAIDSFRDARKHARTEAFYREWCEQAKRASIDNARRTDLPW